MPNICLKSQYAITKWTGAEDPTIYGITFLNASGFVPNTVLHEYMHVP